MKSTNKIAKSKFWCYCGQPATRKSDFDRHLTSLHGVKLLKGALTRTYAEGDVEAYPKMFRRATSADVASLQEKDHKRYEAKIQRRTGAKASASTRDAGEPGDQPAEADAEHKAAGTSPPKKRNRRALCRVLKKSPTAASAEGDASAGSSATPNAGINRSRSVASKDNVNSRYRLRPRPEVPEMSAELFAGLKAARDKKRPRDASPVEPSSASCSGEESSKEEETEDDFIPDQETRSVSKDTSEWIANVAEAALESEGQTIMSELVAPRLVVQAETVNLALVKQEGLHGDIEYGEAIDLTNKGGEKEITPSECSVSSNAPAVRKEPFKLSIFGGRKSRIPFESFADFTVVVKDATRSVQNLPTSTVSVPDPTESPGTVNREEDSGIITAGKTKDVSTGEKRTKDSGTIDVTKAATSEETPNAASVEAGDALATSSKQNRLKSVVVAVPTFKIPRRTTGADQAEEKSMDYIGPLNGPNLGCQIPQIRPEGNPYMATYSRNWQSMKGRPKRVPSDDRARQSRAHLLSPGAFLMQFGRQSLDSYVGRARSAERLTRDSCPDLMRPPGEEGTTSNAPAIEPAVTRRPGPTEEEIQKLNERLLSMAGLEPRWSTEPGAVLTVRRSVSEPDLLEVAEQPTIVIGEEYADTTPGPPIDNEPDREQSAKDNERELMKLAAALERASNPKPDNSGQEKGAGASSSSVPRLPLPPLLASVPQIVQQTWATQQREREDLQKNTVAAGTIGKGRRGKAGKDPDDVSASEAKAPSPETVVSGASDSVGGNGSTEQKTATDAGVASAKPPGVVQDPSGPDRGSAVASKAAGSVPTVPQPGGDEAKKRERAPPKAGSPGVTFVTTNPREKSSTLTGIGSEESESDGVVSVESIGSKSAGNPQITARLTVNLGSPVTVGGGGSSRDRAASRSVTPPSAKKTNRKTPTVTSLAGAITAELNPPSSSNTKTNAPKSSTPSHTTPPSIPHPAKPPTPLPGTQPHQKKPKPPKQNTDASGSAAAGAEAEPTSQRGILKELERELKELETKDVGLTSMVRVARAAVQDHKASLQLAEDQYAAATAGRSTVRKRKQEIQSVMKDFQEVAKRATELLKKKPSA